MLLRPVRRLGAVLGGAWSGGPQRTLITLVERAKAFCAADATSNPTQPAIVSGGSGTQAPTAHTYAQLLADSANLANLLLQRAGRADLNEERVAFLAPATYDYVVMQWSIWRAGGIAVPISSSAPPEDVRYYLEDAQCSLFVSHPSMAALAQDAETRPTTHEMQHLEYDSSTATAASNSSTQSAAADARSHDDDTAPALPDVAMGRRALIIYTSGTTSRPKGVVTTHATIDAQVQALSQAWEWSRADRIYNVLPLHHIHGVVNVVTSALYNGAVCEMPGGFSAPAVWARFAAPPPLTLFMAVPTVYTRLIQAYEQADAAEQAAMSAAAARLRLMVCGSAALPQPIMERWHAISSHWLLERYGSTEFGMALSNPLHGQRQPGFVGLPLPGVEVRLGALPEDQAGSGGAEDKGGKGDEEYSAVGEVLVRGPNVFSEYFRRPEATAEAFDEDGFYRSGDIGAFSAAHNSYAILGRASVDIIKSGGYKISALEIERVLLESPDVAECAVVALPDATWGETIAAVLLPPAGTTAAAADTSALEAFAASRLPSYKRPRTVLWVDAIPRNALGKVNKKSLRKELFGV